MLRWLLHSQRGSRDTRTSLVSFMASSCFLWVHLWERWLDHTAHCSQNFLEQNPALPLRLSTDTSVLFCHSASSSLFCRCAQRMAEAHLELWIRGILDLNASTERSLQVGGNGKRAKSLYTSEVAPSWDPWHTGKLKLHMVRAVFFFKIDFLVSCNMCMPENIYDTTCMRGQQKSEEAVQSQASGVSVCGSTLTYGNLGLQGGSKCS